MMNPADKKPREWWITAFAEHEGIEGPDTERVCVVEKSALDAANRRIETLQTDKHRAEQDAKLMRAAAKEAWDKLTAAEEKVRVLREALEEIAKTDSPWSADFAREALEKVK